MRTRPTAQVSKTTVDMKLEKPQAAVWLLKLDVQLDIEVRIGREPARSLAA